MLVILLTMACGRGSVEVHDTGAIVADSDEDSDEDTDTSTDSDSDVDTSATGDSDTSDSGVDTETGMDTGTGDTADSDTGTVSDTSETGETGAEVDLASCDDVGSDVVIEGLELTCEAGVFTLYWDFSGIADSATWGLSTGGGFEGGGLGDDIACCGSITFTTDGDCPEGTWGYIYIEADDGTNSCVVTGLAPDYYHCPSVDAPVTCDDVP